jgi:hypothetical protein
MQPGFDLRIRSMIKALSETVLPAVDPANKSAIEQLHITLGSLALLREQVDYAHAFEMADLRDMTAILAALPELAGSVSDQTRQVVAKAEALANGAPTSLTRLQDANCALRAAIAEEIAAAYLHLGDGAAARLERWLLQHGQGQISRERAFVAGTGFDVFPESLRTLGELLDE